MATLMIDLPDKLYGKLEELADTSGRSLEAEIIHLLEQSVCSEAAARQTIIEFRALRERHPLAQLTPEERRRAITEGRA